MMVAGLSPAIKNQCILVGHSAKFRCYRFYGSRDMYLLRHHYLQGKVSVILVCHPAKLYCNNLFRTEDLTW